MFTSQYGGDSVSRAEVLRYVKVGSWRPVDVRTDTKEHLTSSRSSFNCSRILADELNINRETVRYRF